MRERRWNIHIAIIWQMIRVYEEIARIETKIAIPVVLTSDECSLARSLAHTRARAHHASMYKKIKLIALSCRD